MAQQYPDAGETLDWTIAFGPGGGNDIMARTIVDILATYDLYPGDIAVENRAGGSGAVGWGYLFGQSGSGYGISTTSGSFRGPRRCRPTRPGTRPISPRWRSWPPMTWCWW